MLLFIWQLGCSQVHFGDREDRSADFYSCAILDGFLAVERDEGI